MKCYQNDNLLHVNVKRDGPNYAHFCKKINFSKMWNSTNSTTTLKTCNFNLNFDPNNEVESG